MTHDFPQSTLLYGSPSAAEGAARVMDLAGLLTEYNRSATGPQADFLALAADWRAVAQDLGAVAGADRPGPASHSPASPDAARTLPGDRR